MYKNILGMNIRQKLCSLFEYFTLFYFILWCSLIIKRLNRFNSFAIFLIVYLLQAFNFETTALPRYRQEPPQTPRYIILHYNSLKLGWDSLILILTFYTAIVVPYNAVFPVKERYITDGWFISDSIVVSILMHFKTGFYNN